MHVLLLAALTVTKEHKCSLLGNGIILKLDCGNLSNCEHIVKTLELEMVPDNLSLIFRTHKVESLLKPS